jgi:hypothetical protein
MKETIFVPKICADFTDDEGVVHKAKFIGSITLRVPNFFERAELKACMMSALTKEGETDIDSVQSGAAKVSIVSIVEKMAKVVEKSVPFYKSVNLKSLSSGIEYNSFEDLGYDSEAEPILQEVAQQLASGLRLSKN